MKSWDILTIDAQELDIELHVTLGERVELLDIATLDAVVTISIGKRIASEDRDSVLRGATDGALKEIRRQGT